MKCNTNNCILRTLVALGCGLEAATKAEIKTATHSLTIPHGKIAYSNTCKMVSHLQYAKEEHVNLTVFDTESELVKIKEIFPSVRLLVRLRCADENAAIPMGHRFGCDHHEATVLIDRCLELSLNLVGVHFHVGCGSSDPFAYARAIAKAKVLFDYASSKGLSLDILDIGGGFPGSLGNITLPFAKAIKIK